MNPLDELSRMTSLFPEEQPLFTAAEHVPGSLVPEPYKGMLVHERHMTVSMEQYHQCPVDVHVVDRKWDGDVYGRKSILTKQGTDDPGAIGLRPVSFRVRHRSS